MDYYQVLLVGASGKGKTYSFRNMDQDKTAFINIENKPLPFRANFKVHERVATTATAKASIQKAVLDPSIEVIIIDSLSAYLDMLLLEARATKKGFDVWNLYNEEVGKFFNYIKSIKKHIFITAHYEWIQDEGGAKERRVKTKGKEWEGVCEKEFTIVLYVDRKINPDTKKVEAWFDLALDNSSSKCPPAIFGDEIFQVENDSNLVLQKINDFTK